MSVTTGSTKTMSITLVTDVLQIRFMCMPIRPAGAILQPYGTMVLVLLAKLMRFGTQLKKSVSV